MDIIYTSEGSGSRLSRESVDSGCVSLSPPSPVNDQPRRRNKKKKRLASTLSSTSFNDLYTLKKDGFLGQGSYGRVETCVNIYTQKEYAVKIINKHSWAFNRQKMLKEIELYYLCQGQESIIQLMDYFEEEDKFYLIFEKAQGGHLLNQIQQRIKFSEKDAAIIMAKLANALKYLHSRGIAHRDLKPENILCMSEQDVASSIRLCDFDLCSKVQPSVSTPRLQSPVGSPEYLAPEVVEVFIEDDIYDLLDEDEDLTYDKRCDLWSLGVIAYTLLSGCLPFRGHCGQDCGWDDRDAECYNCQENLFNAIRQSHIVFPDEHWSHISTGAKDLISKLLRADPNQRIEAAQVLEHPWILEQTTADKSTESNEINEEAILNSPTLLRRAMSSSLFENYLASTACQQPLDFSHHPGEVKASAKLRRQSSVVTFCQPHDYYVRCEL